MGSREAILARLRGQQVTQQPLPEVFREGLTYADPRAQFARVLEQIGGGCTFVADWAALAAAVQALPAVQSARRSCSALPAAWAGNVDLSAIADPHELADVDVAILRGAWAVAENGAVWVTGRAARQRAIYFLTQHLVLVVPAARLVHNLHEAYARLEWTPRDFGAWIAGPSKTADIEQSLVIGAHGPRSLHVFLTEFEP